MDDIIEREHERNIRYLIGAYCERSRKVYETIRQEIERDSKILDYVSVITHTKAIESLEKRS